MKKITSIAIYKPTETAVFEVGQMIMYGEEKTTIKVEKISVFGKTVKIKLSNQNTLVLKGLPISYEY